MGVLDSKTLAFLDVNAAAVRAYGYSRREFLARTLKDLTAREEVPRLRDVVRRLGVSRNLGVFRHKGKKGAAMDVEVTANRIRWNGHSAHLAAVRDVSERLEMERALRASEELMHQMTHTIQDVFYISDAKTSRILYINPAFERIWGRRRDEVLKGPRAWVQWVHPDDRSRLLRSLRSWRPRGQNAEWNEEYRIIRPDGTVCWIWIRSFPIRDASGRIVRFAGVERDITERKLAEESVRSLLEITRQLNATLDVDTLLEALVKETLRLLDAEGGFAGLMTPEGMNCKKYCTRTTVEPFIHTWPRGRGLPGWVAVHKRIYVTNDASRDPVILRPTRRRFGVHRAICAPLLDACGAALGFIQINNPRDDSPFGRQHEEKLLAVVSAASVAVQHAVAYHKLRETAAALHQTEVKYRGIFENAVTGVGRTTPEGRILDANPALARMLGYASPEDLIASVTNVSSLYIEPGARAEMKRQLEEHDSIEGFEVNLRRRDGTPIWLLLNLRAGRDEQGRLLHIDGMAQDITDRRKTEEALREVSGRLLRLQSEERRRIARELHDSTAQTLAALAMNLGLVNREVGSLKAKDRKRLQDSFELAKESCREVRTLSYLLHPPAIEDSDLWSAVRWYARGFSDRCGIPVDLVLPRVPQTRRLPEAIETTLFRIVQESLANIHRHSGSHRARIRIAHTPSRITLVVRDEGRGLRTIAGRRPGAPPLLGVGIAGMRERVRQLGGQIAIDSSPQGTAVRVSLPLRGEH